ncbi:alpha/beta fold hydrolase [Streptomyces sp. NPDC002643]
MPTTSGRLTTPDGTHLAYRDHTPDQQDPTRTLLLMHGLAGHMGEWDDLLPALLAEGHRVVMYDARGHGASTHTPPDMSRAACVRDAVTVIHELGLHRTTPPTPTTKPPEAATAAKSVSATPFLTLVGQSLGGHTAFLLAAEHPELLDSLILIEAGPGTPDAMLPDRIAAWLDNWPPEFASHPRVDRSTMLAAIVEVATTPYWSEWARTTCPTLVVRGSRGTMSAADAAAMPTHRAPGAAPTHLDVIEDAGHDVHLDQPTRLATTMIAFLTTHP